MGQAGYGIISFTKAILSGQPIKVFNNGDMIRDFTYIDDVESVFRLIQKPPKENLNYTNGEKECHESWSPYKIFNIGNSNPTALMDYINELEVALNQKSKKRFLPMQDGDVMSTSADTDLLEKWIKYKPKTSIKEGIKKFVDWYKKYYKV